MVQKFLNSFLYVIGFFVAGAMSIKSLREPDLWWQIRTGEWILVNHQVPKVDVFSFTHQGVNWINIKWGFEVLAAWISNHFGAESVFVIQLLVSVLILFFTFKIMQLSQIKGAVPFCITALGLLIAIEYRIIGRPEMFSHLFVVVYLFLILLYFHNQPKWIFLTIPLQIVWCNVHEAYAIGIVMLLIFAAVESFLYFKNNSKIPLQMSMVVLAAIGALAINPRTYLLLIRPFNIFNQVQQNKYTTELDSIFTAEYWHKEAYFFVITALLFCGYLISLIKRKQLLSNKVVFPLSYLSICVAFMFLALTAYRNIVFFQLAVIPIIAHLAFSYFPNIGRHKIVVAAFAVILYGLIVSNKYYEMMSSRDRFGLEVLSTNNPTGVAKFMEQRQLQSKKGFSDYLTSSYLLWKLQPNFKTFIDLRDLDIFSADFFDQYLEIINRPEKFHELDQKENFDYVVLYTRSNEALHQYLFNDSVYACTYADPVAALYEKTDNIPSGDFFQSGKAIPTSNFATALNHIANPLYESFDYEQLNTDYEAAAYYTLVGKISLAEKRINQYLYAFPENENALQLKNQIINLKTKIKR